MRSPIGRTLGAPRPSSAARAAAAVPPQLRQAVLCAYWRSVTDEQQLPTTPRLQRILARAGDIAREHGAQAVGAERVVLATLEDERAVPTQVLARAVDVARVRGELAALLTSPGNRGAG